MSNLLDRINDVQDDVTRGAPDCAGWPPTKIEASGVRKRIMAAYMLRSGCLHLGAAMTPVFLAAIKEGTLDE